MIGANPVSRPNWRAPYSHLDMFHEPVVLFGYLAGVTQQIEFCHRHHHSAAAPNRLGRQAGRGARCLERRPAALRHRHRLEPGGIRSSRRRFQKSRPPLRRADRSLAPALDPSDSVTFEGRWHKITDAGINPLPVQRPIPIWFGGSDERALRPVGAYSATAGFRSSDRMKNAER